MLKVTLGLAIAADRHFNMNSRLGSKEFLLLDS